MNSGHVFGALFVLSVIPWFIAKWVRSQPDQPRTGNGAQALDDHLTGLLVVRACKQVAKREHRNYRRILNGGDPADLPAQAERLARAQAALAAARAETAKAKRRYDDATRLTNAQRATGGTCSAS